MTSRRAGLGALALLALSPSLFAQSQAANGTIEGVVRDTTGAVLPGVTVTVFNLETGATRSPLTDGGGNYRALLLPLGAYRVKAEITGFKAVERTGITLSAGQTAVINVTLEVGGVAEVVSVSGEAPVAQPGKIDLGRTISEAEVKNLPLVSRNPYNFALLQPNVTGYENEEFGVPRVNANGTQMHTNFQIDGNTNTEKDRAGLRLLPTSEVFVREVKVITSGFAPEFGQTTGMVFNAVTPSGTNELSGSASYRFLRKGQASRPFFLAPTASKPDLYANDYTATLGGPILKDRWHFYLGYEYVDRDLSADRVITVTPANAQRLSLSPEAVPGVMPATQGVNFFIAKTDYQIDPSNKLSGRYLFFKNSSPYNVGGGLLTVERATDFADRMDSASAQLISSMGASRLNELRLQFARRSQARVPSSGAAAGAAVDVSGVAQFGGPYASNSDAGFTFDQKIWQVVDNFSWIRGRHNLKVGFDVQHIDDSRRNALRQLYTFATVDAYLGATSGATPRSYSTFVQDVGDPAVDYSSNFYGVFVQDDLRISPSFKLLFGLRYDLFDVPSARTFAANPASQSFKIDKNNFAPRAGFSWSLDSAARTVVRASTGIMYEPPLLMFYEDAIRLNGDPKLLSVTLNPTSAGAPAYPGSLADLPPGFTPPRQSITAVDPAFSTQYTILSNVQIERALGEDFSVGFGYVNSTGRAMPVLVDANLIATGATLGDGRPIFSTAVNASTRVNPVFNHVDTFQSAGTGSYNALTVTLGKRMSHGVQFQASYTWAKGQDNAPLTGTYVVGSNDDRISIPGNLGYDKGVVPFNQTHTLVCSGLLQPRVEGTGFWPVLANHNQLGFILQWNSGLPFNIRSNRDLNQDGVQNDRPLSIDRNTGRLGRVLNLDARYSRFLPFGRRVRMELFVEAKNLLNVDNVAAVNRIIPVDLLGNPQAAIPDEFPGTGGYQQRRIQLGAKVTF
jgi:hypothetical protein